MMLSFLKQSTAKRRDIILNGRIVPTILFLSVPTMLMGFVQSMLPVIDGLFINNLAGIAAASAVTYSGSIVMMMAAASQGLSVAAMSIIGQMNGRGEFAHAKYISTQVFVAAFVLGCLIAPFMFLISFPISGHVNHQISRDVFLYISLNALVLPFSFLEAVYNAVKNSNGKPEATFIRMLFMLVLKVLFNFLFIAFFPFGIIGAVMSSLFSNLIISVWMYYELFVKKSEDKLELRGFRFDAEVIRELFHVGVPSMINSVMLNLGFFLINNEVEKYGTISLNGQGIANNITSICFNLPSSFGSAVTTMVSMNVGHSNGKKACRCCVVGCVVSAVTAALLILIVVPSSKYITILFTRDPAVLAMANKALHIYTYSVIGFGICMVQIGAFIGLGRTVIPLVIGVLRIWLLRFLFILATERFLGVDSVFWGNLFSNYTAALITTILLLRVKWVSVIERDFQKLGSESGSHSNPS